MPLICARLSPSRIMHGFCYASVATIRTVGIEDNKRGEAVALLPDLARGLKLTALLGFADLSEPQASACGPCFFPSGGGKRTPFD